MCVVNHLDQSGTRAEGTLFPAEELRRGDVGEAKRSVAARAGLGTRADEAKRPVGHLLQHGRPCCRPALSGDAAQSGDVTGTLLELERQAAGGGGGLNDA